MCWFDLLMSPIPLSIMNRLNTKLIGRVKYWRSCLLHSWGNINISLVSFSSKWFQDWSSNVLVLVVLTINTTQYYEFISHKTGSYDDLQPSIFSLFSMENTKDITFRTFSIAEFCRNQHLYHAVLWILLNTKLCGIGRGNSQLSPMTSGSKSSHSTVENILFIPPIPCSIMKLRSTKLTDMVKLNKC